mgnify:CR=1 FL=1
MLSKIISFFDGKKTYAVLSVGVIHQGLKVAGIDVPQENLSITIDVLSLVFGMIFRAMAKKG